jgi:hypothetical protein
MEELGANTALGKHADRYWRHSRGGLPTLVSTSTRLSDENPGLSASTASEKLIPPHPKPRSDGSGRRFQPILASHTPDASLEVEQEVMGAALVNSLDNRRKGRGIGA